MPGWFLFVICSLLILSVEAQSYSVACVVTDANTHSPIEGALCTDNSTGNSGVSDSTGYFLFPTPFPSGPRTMNARKPGYAFGSTNYNLNSNMMKVQINLQSYSPVFRVACVVKDESNNPIPGANCTDGTQSGITNQDGYFLFPTPFLVGERVMRASKTGYNPGCTPYYNDRGQNIFVILQRPKLTQQPCFDENGNRITFPFCNSALSPEDRAKDLVSRLTNAEKAASLSSNVPSISRLGVPQLNMGEALHGVVQGCVNNQCPTGFPAPSALGASFDSNLFHDVGRAIGFEMRALSNFHTNGLNNGPLVGFAPNINLARDPRWGRAQEVPGEDPTLTSIYAYEFITGFQGNEKTLLAANVAKHYAVYDLEGNWAAPGLNGSTWQTAPWDRAPNQPSERFNFDSRPYNDDFQNYYLDPWKSVATAGSAGVMCSYNSVNGIPSCLNSELLNLLRQNLGFNGFVISDYMAIAVAMNCQNWNGTTCQPFPGHGYISSNQPIVAVSKALTAGTDTNLGQSYNLFLGTAISQGAVSIDVVNQALVRVFTIAFRLGLFEPENVYSCISLGVVDSDQHRNLALHAARESIVLLKNSGILPLNKSLSVAFIGPHANATEAMLSNYHGDNHLVNSHSPLQVAQSRGLHISYAKGCNICDQSNFPNYPNAICPKKPSDQSGFTSAVNAAKSADVVVMFLGLDQTFEAESFDRNSSFSWGPRGLGVPEIQNDLFNLISSTGKPIVVVLLNGGALSVELFDSKASAIVEAWYGGELGGDAIIDILFGDYSPAGRMPATTYLEEFANQRDFRDLSLKPSGNNPGITHLYYNKPVLYQFGHGLSYPKFRISSFEMESRISLQSIYDDPIPLSVSVESLGPFPKSDFVILVFVENKLASFRRLHDISAQEIREVSLKLDPIFFADQNSQFTSNKKFEISIGGAKDGPETVKHYLTVN